MVAWNELGLRGVRRIERREVSVRSRLRSIAGLSVLGAASLLGPIAAPAATVTADESTAREVRVPQDVATLQAAIDGSRPGDVILLDRGVYRGGVVVPPDRPGITIRGIDRNA